MCDRRMNPSVTSECIDGITVVTLNRPDVRNAVDADTARDLHAAFLALTMTLRVVWLFSMARTATSAPAGTFRPVPGCMPRGLTERP
jgi:enoyl-CoA hydratase/carnithine racemase